MEKACGTSNAPELVKKTGYHVMFAGSLLWTTTSTCAWTATTSQLRTGCKSHNLNFGQIVKLSYFQGWSWSRNHLRWSRGIFCHQLLEVLPRPDQEVSGPLQETSRAGKVWPHHRADQHEASTGTLCIWKWIIWIFIYLRHQYMENALVSPSQFTITMSTEQGNVSHSKYFVAQFLL